MKPIPDLDDVPAMAQTGRRSVLMRLRNEACEAIRDASQACQSVDIGDTEEVGKCARDAIAAATRLIDVAGLWKHVK